MIDSYPSVSQRQYRLTRRPLLTIGISLALLTAGLVADASGGVNKWTTNGPGGGRVVSLVIDPLRPATLYAGTMGNLGGEGGGVFKSVNGGESWAAINAGLTNTSVFALAIDPSSPATLYAGTQVGGVFRSTNGGENWTGINTGLSNTTVSALAIDPSAPATVYAGTDGGIFKSTDAGGSWTRVVIFPAPYRPGAGSVQSLAIDPSAPTTLYAGTYANGVHKSSNGGGSWTPINAGLSRGVVNALIIDRSSPTTLYAGTAANGFAPGGLFKSANGGGSWVAVNAGLTNTNVWPLAIDPSSPATLYAGTLGGGVFRTTNGGENWTAINTGLSDTNVFALAIDPSAPATVYAGTQGGGVFDYETVSAAAACLPSSTTLCLNGGRFKVEVSWSVPSQGTSGVGTVVPLTGDAGVVWFFSANNHELMVKVLDGRAFNDRFWFFSAPATNVRYTITVTDTVNNVVKTYTSLEGQVTNIQDTSGFLP